MVDFNIRIHIGDGELDIASALRYASLAGIRFACLIMPSDGDLVPALSAVKQVRCLSLYAGIESVVGVEFRHIPPALLPSVVQEARRAGIAFVMAYGESIQDQVAEGTNLAAIEAGVDVISHPGLIDVEAASFAAERGVALEITASPKHGLTNGHIAAVGLHAGCLLVCGSGATKAREIPGRSFWPRVICGAVWSLDGQMQEALEKKIRKSEELLIQRLRKRG